jgi:hypothetical protein
MTRTTGGEKACRKGGCLAQSLRWGIMPKLELAVARIKEIEGAWVTGTSLSVRELVDKHGPSQIYHRFPLLTTTPSSRSLELSWQ